MGKSLKGKELGRGITQRRDGRYQISYTTKFKKRITLYAKTEEEARFVLKKATANTSDGLTLNDWYDIWDRKLSSHLRGSTKNTYQTRYRKLSKRIGDIPLKELTHMDIQEAFNEMESDASRKASKELLSLLMNAAVHEGIIDKNPGAHCKWKVDGDIKEERKILSYEDEAKLEAVMKKDGSFYLFFRLALETGMRVGEIHGLCLEDVDFNLNVIHVRHTFIYIPNMRVLNPPKSRASLRDIPMSAKAREVLLYAVERKKRIAEKHAAPEGFENVIIVSRNNMPIDEPNTKDMLRRYSKKAGVEYVTPHGLRHTFATRCIAKGMKPKVLQKILGHSSLKLTMDLYCHVEYDTMRDEMGLVFMMA